MTMANGTVSAFDIFTGGTGAIVASAVILRASWYGWQRTLGSRRHLRAKLVRIRIGMSTEYVLQVFGVPTFGTAATKLRDQPFNESHALWDLNHVFLACHFEDGQLWAFTVVRRDRWFHLPLDKLSRGMLSGQLGRQHFDRAAPHVPSSIEITCGASRAEYAEVHYFGRPGGYADYVLAGSTEAVPECGPTSPIQNETDPSSTGVAAYRRLNKVTGVTVASSEKGGGRAFHLMNMDQVQHASLFR